MRTFVAIKIESGEELLGFINNIHHRLRDEKIKWVHPDNMHLTLFFLGETEDSQIQSIGTGLREIAENSMQISLMLSGIGVFKNIRDPRVIWIGLKENQYLVDFHSRIQKFIGDQGFPKDDRPFRPHLTIGRPKRIHNRETLREIIEKNRDRTFQESIVEDIIFYQSIRKERGPEYRVIEKLGLRS